MELLKTTPIAFFVSKRNNKWKVGKINDRDKDFTNPTVLLTREIYDKIKFVFEKTDLINHNKISGFCRGDTVDDGFFKFLSMSDEELKITFYRIWELTMQPDCVFIHNTKIGSAVLSIAFQMFDPNDE